MLVTARQICFTIKNGKMESKFKIGDKVRFNSEWGSYRFEDSLTKGEVVEISDITDCGSIYVKKYVEAHVTDDEIELVEPFDPKTACIMELKELMERYQVEIDCGGEDVICNKWLKFIFPDTEITYDNEIRRNHKCFPFPITPSNIFDYDK